MSVAEFVQWTWQMVNGSHPEIGWSDDGAGIVVANPERLAKEVLPLYFRHQQYASWVRALNAYDFKKAGPNRWSHPSFIRGKEDLLSNIRRKPPPSRRAGGATDNDMSRPEDDRVDMGTHAIVPLPGSMSTASGAPRAAQSIHTTLQEARQQLWWLENRESMLIAELEQVREDDFKLRFDAVRIMQAFLAKMLPRVNVTNTGAERSGPSGSSSPHVIFNPDVIPPDQLPPGASTARAGGAMAGVPPSRPALQVSAESAAAANGAGDAGDATRKRPHAALESLGDDAASAASSEAAPAASLSAAATSSGRNGTEGPPPSGAVPPPSPPPEHLRRPPMLHREAADGASFASMGSSAMPSHLGSPAVSFGAASATSEGPLFDISELEMFSAATPSVGASRASSAPPDEAASYELSSTSSRPSPRLPPVGSKGDEFMSLIVESLGGGGGFGSGGFGSGGGHSFSLPSAPANGALNGAHGAGEAGGLLLQTPAELRGVAGVEIGISSLRQGGGIPGLPRPQQSSSLQPVAAPSMELEQTTTQKLLHFASVLARMPKLPESTSALPAIGTIQRDQLDKAINWCFMQIRLL